MKKLIMSLFMMFILPSYAATNPTVTLKTASLGYPYTQPFTVNALFSEAVSDFNASKINISNGTVTDVTEEISQLSFIITVKPKMPGSITLSIPANAVSSVSSGMPNLASNTLRIMGLDPNLRPSSNFDLSHWSLTLPLPIGNRNNAISIGPVTLNGSPSLNNGYTNPPYFFTDPASGAMSFMVPLNGATTPNSDFSRCELMEVLPGSKPTWKLSTFSSNILTASVRIDHVPPIEKRFVIGQIHDKGNTDSLGNKASNSPLLKLYYDANETDPNHNPCNGCIYGQVRVTPSQAQFLKILNLIQNIPLNTIFIYKITLLKDGSLTIKANDVSTRIQLNTSSNNTLGWGAQELYFKAGAYNLEHDSTEGGADSFYSLQVTHD